MLRWIELWSPQPRQIYIDAAYKRLPESVARMITNAEVEEDAADEAGDVVPTAARGRFASWSAPADCSVCADAARRASAARRTVTPQGRRQGQPGVD